VSLIIHAFPPSPRAFKVLLTANHLGLDYQFQLVDMAKGEQRTPAFAALNPNQRMPVLEHDGYVLWESNAIVQYLALLKPQAGLLAPDTRPRLQIEKWLFWESAHWDATCAIYMFENVVKKMFGRGEPSQSELARGAELFARIAPVLEGQFQKHRHVAGEALSVADFAIAAPLCHAEMARFPLQDYPGIRRWQADIQALPAWARTVAMQR
jgi:glutathione S-transferase